MCVCLGGRVDCAHWTARGPPLLTHLHTQAHSNQISPGAARCSGTFVHHVHIIRPVTNVMYTHSSAGTAPQRQQPGLSLRRHTHTHTRTHTRTHTPIYTRTHMTDYPSNRSGSTHTIARTGTVVVCVERNTKKIVTAAVSGGRGEWSWWGRCLYGSHLA